MACSPQNSQSLPGRRTKEQYRDTTVEGHTPGIAQTNPPYLPLPDAVLFVPCGLSRSGDRPLVIKQDVVPEDFRRYP